MADQLYRVMVPVLFTRRDMVDNREQRLILGSTVTLDDADPYVVKGLERGQLSLASAPGYEDAVVTVTPQASKKVQVTVVGKGYGYNSASIDWDVPGDDPEIVPAPVSVLHTYSTEGTRTLRIILDSGIRYEFPVDVSQTPPKR
jgi:hypothetical protein